ncbi:MAG TPA: UDP-2,3-diacylglucosamine diphosphatase LpxI [Verrucomicrobiae bacterium]
MELNIDSLGIIAGSRTLPLLIAQEARKAGVRKVTAVAFEGETDPEISTLVDSVTWLRVGQLSKMVEAFKKQGVQHCVMAGQIAPRNLFEVRPDLRAMMLLFKLKEKNAHTIFGGIANELAKDGITLIEATPWLKSVMPGEGFHIGPKLSKEEREDVEFGFQIAKEVSRLEIGQTVVVKEGVVLAVEGFEGTDTCLTRGGSLAGSKGGAVAVKVAKKNHDMRFDIPCIGAQTIKTCQEAGVKVLALEAGKTIILEKAEVEKSVVRNGPAIVAVS